MNFYECVSYGTPNATKMRRALAHAKSNFGLVIDLFLKIDFGCKNRSQNRLQNQSRNRSVCIGVWACSVTVELF